MKNSKVQSTGLYPDIDNNGDLCKSNIKDCDIIIVSTLYHKEIVRSMMYSFISTINRSTKVSIGFVESPGSFELPITIQIIAEKYKPKLFLAVGCIIKGETNHDSYLSSSVTEGLMNLSLKFSTPILNGVLTTNTLQQAIDRAGKNLDKGKDLAEAAIEMLAFTSNFK